ncbi:MAG: class I SAM-dependent methyltransferase [Candidatus Omnitrophota bacterium]|jgi:methylase of polypeptide subunit release factors
MQSQKARAINIDLKAIRRLRSLLDEACYNLAADIAVRPSGLNIKSLPERLTAFLELFHLNRKITSVCATRAFGKRFLAELVKLGLVVAEGRHIKPVCGIRCINGYYFIYDYDVSSCDYAYMGEDTDIFARCLPLNLHGKKALDLCTGTGIQAILLDHSADQITAVDISARAANFARFNVALNGLGSKVSILRGDLFGPVKGKRFDLIVSNPPYIPIPENLNFPLAAKGGEDGLLVLKRIIGGIKSYMAKNGLGLVLGITPGAYRAPFVLSMLTKTAKTSRLDIDLILLQRKPKQVEVDVRPCFLLGYNRKPFSELKKAMADLYARTEADFLYTYLIKLRPGKGRVELVDLCGK